MPYSDDEMAEFKDAFALFDQKGDNTIENTQIKDLLRSMGLNPVGTDIEKIERDFKGKKVSFEEWLSVYDEEKEKPPPVKEDFIEGFKVFDRDGSGSIDTGTFAALLCNKGDTKLNSEEADVLLLPLEDPKKGSVAYNDLIKLVMSKPEQWRKSVTLSSPNRTAWYSKQSIKVLACFFICTRFDVLC